MAGLDWTTVFERVVEGPIEWLQQRKVNALCESLNMESRRLNTRHYMLKVHAEGRWGVRKRACENSEICNDAMQQ